uniref:Small ribosomal subunit protein uS3 n=1 Tax=uncultured bacterium Rifle_16ft_4_minimus_4564 TaxID=1665161 RepID=A0A0H4TCL2_9BACT|nr:30S ribosomal protein S3, small subunit ribosomal protein S3 [uncultured bacterium Rifle_16ft_4_minimus_4564]
MGQKSHPIGLRLGIVKTWSSRWFSNKNYSKLLHEDLKIRSHIKKRLYHAGISRIDIERAAKKIRISIYTARPGIIIGKKGQEAENLKIEIQRLTTNEIILNIIEVRKPGLDAQLAAENIALQIEKRVSYKRAMKRTVFTALKFGALGVKVAVAGRLAGSEIARSEWYREGRVPLHTLRADIDYGFATAYTVYGTIGVKVWIFKGEILEKDKKLVGKSETEMTVLGE